MNANEVVQYWLELAEDDWPVVERLFASGDYHYALFFGHLYLERLLKAVIVKKTGEHAPRLHNLTRLAESAGLIATEAQREVLVRVTAYNLETRYPEERFSARKRYTEEYTKAELDTIQEIGKWLKSLLL
jgi:HEPN domain-containing protein